MISYNEPTWISVGVRRRSYMKIRTRGVTVRRVSVEEFQKESEDVLRDMESWKLDVESRIFVGDE